MKILEVMPGECDEHHGAWLFVYEPDDYTFDVDICWRCWAVLEDGKRCNNKTCRAIAALTGRCWGTHNENETDW